MVPYSKVLTDHQIHHLLSAIFVILFRTIVIISLNKYNNNNIRGIKLCANGYHIIDSDFSANLQMQMPYQFQN